ncbi:MAG: hypothetical protein ACR2PY_06745, partial [Salinispira sp.]
LWVADGDRDVIDAYPLHPSLSATDLTNGDRDTSKDFATIAVAGEDIEPHGIWSDGATMWVADDATDRIYAYDMATGARPSNY